MKKPDKKGARARRSPGLELDCELAFQINEGNPRALEQLVDRHLGAVYKYLERRIGPGHDKLKAEVTAATFEAAMRRMRAYTRGTASAPMRLWLIKLAGRQLARRLPEIQKAKATSTQDPPAQSDDVQLLRRAMSRLPARHQAALSLALFEQMPPEEIAGALGVHPWRAMRLLRVALRRLDVALHASAGES